MKKFNLILVAIALCFFGMINTNAATSGNYEYTVLNDGTVQIDKYNGTDSTLTIPSTIASKKVTVIGRAAFAENYYLNLVVLPNTVTTLSYAAFANCYNLTSINLGSGLTTIGDYAFQNTKISSIKFPDSLTTIGSYIFFGNTSITSINIPKNVKTIGIIGHGASSLKSIYVASTNAYFKSVNGVLMNKKKTELISYPANKADTSYQIPTTVTKVSDYAFSGAKNVTSITITGNVKTLGEGAFYGVKKITTISVPKNVTSIGYFLFANCESLKTANIKASLDSTSYRMFDNCKNLQTVTFSGNINKTSNRTFYQCPSLQTVSFNGKLNTVGSYTFQECPKLKTINFPTTLTNVESKFIYDCNDNVGYKIPANLTQLDDGSYKILHNVTLVDGTYNYDLANAVLPIVNEERKKVGAGSLAMDKRLTEAAMKRAKELAILFEHIRPTGQSIYTVFPNTSVMSGENIAAGQTTAKSVMQSWMNSPGHKANILKSGYNSIGIGCYTQNGITFWVQLFSADQKQATSTTKGTQTKTEQEKVDPKYITNFRIESYNENSTINLDVGKSLTMKNFYLYNAGWSYASAKIKGSDFTWKSTNTKVFTVTQSGTIKAIGAGSAKLKVTLGNITKTYNVVVKGTLEVEYQGRAISTWQGKKVNGATAGQTNKKLTGLKVQINNALVSGNVEYRSYVEGLGWEKTYKKNGVASGTSGRKILAVQIKLTGSLASKYDIYYRVYMNGKGWLGWAKNGASAGTEGYNYQIDQIQIKLVKKGGDSPGSTKNSFMKMSLDYRTRLTTVWQSYKTNGVTSGGKNQKITGLQLSLKNQTVSGNVEYRSHIQDIGWDSWKKSGTISGNKSKRTEAIQLRLTGNMAKKYDIYYRVYVQNKGWLGWAKNGASAGTQGYSLRAEQVQIKLVKKGGSAPGSTKNPFLKK